MLVLARGGAEAQISISDIAEAEGISVPYASKLLAILRKAGLVEASRGRRGGFSLSRKAAEINLLEILTTLGGPLIDPDHCRKRTGQLDICVHGTHCSVHEILGGLAGHMSEILESTTLTDVISRELPDKPLPGTALPMAAGPPARPSRNMKDINN